MPLLSAESSVLLLIGDKPTTPVSTSPLALELDESQYAHDYGPCLHAARTGDEPALCNERDTRAQ